MVSCIFNGLFPSFSTSPHVAVLDIDERILRHFFMEKIDEILRPQRKELDGELLNLRDL